MSVCVRDATCVFNRTTRLHWNGSLHKIQERISWPVLRVERGAQEYSVGTISTGALRLSWGRYIHIQAYACIILLMTFQPSPVIVVPPLMVYWIEVICWLFPILEQVMTTSSPLFSALQLTYTMCECAYRSKDRALVLGLSITAYPRQVRGSYIQLRSCSVFLSTWHQQFHG